MQTLPAYIYVLFGLTLLLAVLLFYRAAHNANRFLLLISGWAVLQSALAINGFFLVENTFPPRFALALLPLFGMLVLFNTKNGRRFIDSLDIKKLTLVHIIRIPVELVLLMLFTHKVIPQLMTFEGRNFDIISGLTAPLVYWLAFKKAQPNRFLLIAWNLLCLALVLNIAVNAVLSVPTPIQKFGFDQSNIALMYFPFILLPACLVPIVIFSHLAALRQLWFNNQAN